MREIEEVEVLAAIRENAELVRELGALALSLRGDSASLSPEGLLERALDSKRTTLAVEPVEEVRREISRTNARHMLEVLKRNTQLMRELASHARNLRRDSISLSPEDLLNQTFEGFLRHPPNSVVTDQRAYSFAALRNTHNEHERASAAQMRDGGQRVGVSPTDASNSEGQVVLPSEASNSAEVRASTREEVAQVRRELAEFIGRPSPLFKEREVRLRMVKAFVLHFPSNARRQREPQTMRSIATRLRLKNHGQVQLLLNAMLNHLRRRFPHLTVNAQGVQ